MFKKSERVNFRKLQLWLLMLLVGTSSAVAQPAEVVWLPYPKEGIELGQGYDLLNNRKSSAVCIDFFPVEDTGLETTYEISRVRSFSETFSKFDISASGQLSLAILKASASMNFANSARTISNAERYAVNAKVRRGAFYVSPVPGSKPGGTLSSSDDGEGSDVPVPGNGDVSSSQIDWKSSGIDEENFENLCGTHYVAAILTGVDIKATITTSESSSDEKSSFGGSAEADIGGFFKAKAELSGASEAIQKLHNSSVASYILGGHKYKLPTTVEELATHIREATDSQVEEAPRPMMIGVMSYKGIGSGSQIDAFESADTLKPGIFAYFSAREALDRLNLANEYRLSSTEQSAGIVLHDEFDLYNNLDIAYRSMVSIRGALRTCRDLLRQENENRVRNARSRIQGNNDGAAADTSLRAVYDTAAQIATENRDTARESLDEQASQGQRTSEVVTIEDCLTGLVSLPSVEEAQKVFLDSLISMPFYPKDLLKDPWITGEDLLAAASQVKTLETTAQVEYDRQLAELEVEHRACLTAAQKNQDFGKLKIDSDITSINPVGVTEEEAAACLKTYTDQKVILDENLTDEMAKAHAEYQKVSEAISRHIYRAHFVDLRRGMCGDDLGHQICAMTYPQVTNRVRSGLSLSEDDMAFIVRELTPDSPPPPEPKKTKVTPTGKPKKTYVHHGCYHTPGQLCP